VLASPSNINRGTVEWLVQIPCSTVYDRFLDKAVEVKRRRQRIAGFSSLRPVKSPPKFILHWFMFPSFQIIFFFLLVSIVLHSFSAAFIQVRKSNRHLCVSGEFVNGEKKHPPYGKNSSSSCSSNSTTELCVDRADSSHHGNHKRAFHFREINASRFYFVSSVQNLEQRPSMYFCCCF
jgi:hypothetical protein